MFLMVMKSCFVSVSLLAHPELSFFPVIPARNGHFLMRNFFQQCCVALHSIRNESINA
jgi:hypothetical protein